MSALPEPHLAGPADSSPAPTAGIDERWQRARELLAVRLDNLGDVLMTTPALAAMRESLPGARITLLTSAAGAALAPHLAMVDDVIVFDAPWVKPPRDTADVAAAAAAITAMSARLRERRFDAAAIFTVCTQSALPAAMLCTQAAIPLRLAHCRENPYVLLSDAVKDDERPAAGMRHEARRQLDLVASVGLRTRDERLRFHQDPQDVRSLRRKLVQAGGDPARPTIVVHPGASASSRRYPPEHFGLAADAIVAATGCQVVFTGGASERELVLQARAAMRRHAVLLAGELTLGELAALIAGAQVTLCNNSAPAHLAAALGSPVVVLYALTNPQHTPWQVNARVLSHDVPCANCLKSACPEGHHGCLLGVPAQAVAQAALELIGPLPARPPRGLHKVHVE